MKDIKSFTVDHDALEIGVYERDVKDGVKSWDIRFKKPNTERMTPEISHTLEHLLATYFKNVLKEVTFAVCPMGCLTGFYILTKEETSISTMLVGLLGAAEYIKAVDTIPGADRVSCGSYQLHDLEGAKATMDEFYKDFLDKSRDRVLDHFDDWINKNIGSDRVTTDSTDVTNNEAT